MSKMFTPSREPEVKIKYGYKIPVASVWLSNKEYKYVQEALQSTFISGGEGKFLDQFEKLFAEKTGAKYAVAVNSGTSAVHLGYRLIGIKRGDEVICPDFTMVSTVTPLLEMGAVPVFVDCDDYLQIDVKKIEEKITDKTKAIAVTHVYGIPADIDAIKEVAKKYKLKVLYDSAEAHGALYKGEKLGKFGNVNCYSMYANKNITTGEGGVVTFNDGFLYEEAKRIIDEYFSPVAHFWHESYGYSYRFSNLLAAIGVGQLERFEEIMEAKHQVMKWYREMLTVPGVKFLEIPEYAKSADWVVAVMLDEKEFPVGRNELRNLLAEEGIQTRTFFIPMHLQPVMKLYSAGSYPKAEKAAETGLYFPSSPLMSQQALRYIADRMWEVYEKYS